MDTGRGNALVLGANSEVGAEVARRLVGLSSILLIHGPDELVLASLRMELANRNRRCRVIAVAGDFASLRAAREVTRRVASIGGLDVIVNAVNVPPTRSRAFTEDGNELTWQTNYLAPALIVMGLVPVLRHSRAGRIIHVLADSQRGVPRVADSPVGGRYYPTWSYVEAKLAMMMLSQSMAERLAGSSCRSLVIQPDVARTGAMPAALARGLLVDAVLYACTSPAVPNGGCLRGLRAESLPGAAANPAAQRRMWHATCEALALDHGTGRPLGKSGPHPAPAASALARGHHHHSTMPSRPTPDTSELAGFAHPLPAHRVRG